MASNDEIEMRWIDAWSDLHEMAQHQQDLRDHRDMPCLLPEGEVISFDEGLGWLQDSVYAGHLVRVEAGWVGHRRGAILHRWQAVAGHAHSPGNAGPSQVS